MSEIQELLKNLEWSGTDVFGMAELTCKPTVIDCCPYCRRDKIRGKHAEYCLLEKLLKEAQK